MSGADLPSPRGRGGPVCDPHLRRGHGLHQRLLQGAPSPGKQGDKMCEN